VRVAQNYACSDEIEFLNDFHVMKNVIMKLFDSLALKKVDTEVGVGYNLLEKSCQQDDLFKKKSNFIQSVSIFLYHFILQFFFLVCT